MSYPIAFEKVLVLEQATKDEGLHDSSSDNYSDLDGSRRSGPMNASIRILRN